MMGETSGLIGLVAAVYLYYKLTKNDNEPTLYQSWLEQKASNKHLKQLKQEIIERQVRSDKEIIEIQARLDNLYEEFEKKHGHPYNPNLESKL